MRSKRTLSTTRHARREDCGAKVQRKTNQGVNWTGRVCISADRPMRSAEMTVATSDELKLMVGHAIQHLCRIV